MFMDMPSNRRLRLKDWFAERSIPEAEKSYISQLINGKSSFGEKAARRLEQSYGMTTGYLDSKTQPLPQVSENKESLSDHEKELLQAYRGLKLQKHRYQVIGIIKDLLDSESVQHIKSGDYSAPRKDKAA